MKDVSQATLDVIESVKNKQTIKFDYQYKYGANDDPKTYTVTPLGFFGDFVGFEGTDEGTEDRQFKRFRFDNVTSWIGITKPVKVLVELEFNGYPTVTEVEEEIQRQLTSSCGSGLLWRVEDE